MGTYPEVLEGHRSEQTLNRQVSTLMGETGHKQRGDRKVESKASGFTVPGLPCWTAKVLSSVLTSGEGRRNSLGRSVRRRSIWAGEFAVWMPLLLDLSGPHSLLLAYGQNLSQSWVNIRLRSTCS